jgi:hypothetical protein
MHTHAVHTFSFAARPVFVPTTVGVTIIAPDDPMAPGDPIVLFTELRRVNAGRSVTNAIEDLATAVRRLLPDPHGRALVETNPKDIVWIEMYSDTLSYRDAGLGLTLDWVELEWTGTQYRRPQWTRLLHRPARFEAVLPARVARRLAWLGVDTLAGLDAEVQRAEREFEAQLRDLTSSQYSAPTTWIA